MTASLAQRLHTSPAGRYAIEREVGRGGMATVFLAHDIRHDHRVAVKVLEPDLGAVLGAERRLVEIKRDGDPPASAPASALRLRQCRWLAVL